MHKPILPFVEIQLLFWIMNCKDQTFDHLNRDSNHVKEQHSLAKIGEWFYYYISNNGQVQQQEMQCLEFITDPSI